MTARARSDMVQRRDNRQWSTESAQTGTALPSAPARPVDRRLQRLPVALARVGRAGHGVDVGAPGSQRLLAEDRLGARVDRLGAGARAAHLDGLDARELAAGERDADLHERERRRE